MLFGSGVALLFVVWFAATGVHVLAYLRRVGRLAAADWRRRHGLAGAALRRVLVLLAPVGGLILAAATLPLAASWNGWLA